MALVDKTVKVSKECDELGSGIVKFSAAIKGALSNGWQPGDDLGIILGAAMTDLVPAFQGVEKVGGEFEENRAAFLRSWALVGVDMVDLFFPKAVQVPVKP